MLRVVPVQPTEAMLDRAVAFALCVSLSGSYGWTQYMRDLWARFLDEPEPADLLARARWHQRQAAERSEEHTSELQSLMRISYAVFCLKKKKNITTNVANT